MYASPPLLLIADDKPENLMFMGELLQSRLRADPTTRDILLALLTSLDSGQRPGRP